MHLLVRNKRTASSVSYMFDLYSFTSVLHALKS